MGWVMGRVVVVEAEAGSAAVALAVVGHEATEEERLAAVKEAREDDKQYAAVCGAAE